MSSFDRQKKDSPAESAPLLQGQQQPGAPTGAGIPQQHYGAATGNASYGSSYFMPPPGHYSIPIQQPQQNRMIIHSPNQATQQVVGPGDGTGGMMPQPPFYYPFQSQEGTVPQYPYPVYPMQQQQQQQQRPQQRMAPNGSTPVVNTISHSPTTSGSLPPLGDIFNAPGGRESQSGYGSLSTSPKVYNAPINRRPPSGRTSQQPPQAMRRTNSSNEFKQLQKGGGSKTKEHRRVHSDSPLRLSRMGRRASTEEAPGGSSGGHHRARTLSGGNPFARPRHRRADSASSYHSMGGGSYNAGSIADSSQVSMRSNIAKSSLFAGVDEEGRPLLYYPYEAIRLVMIPDYEKRKQMKLSSRRGDYDDIDSDDDTAEEEDHLPLTIGHLYSDEPANIEDYYEDYHRVSDDLEQGLTPQWESLDTHPLRKNRKGGSNQGFTDDDKQELLPPTNYVVAVSDDIYRRMFSEVADAQSMPCGLFFCGHHEDVDHPSVWIPASLVIILFSTLLYLSYLTEG